MTDMSSPEMDTEFVYDEGTSPCEKEDIQAFGKVFLPVLYTLVFAIGLVGNLLVTSAILKGREKRTITDIFLLNLAISDLLFVISLPFWASYAVRGWTLGNLSCKIVSSFYYVGFFGGIFFISLISIDRYMAIVHAAFSIRARTVSHGFLAMLGVWIVAILVSVPQFVFIQRSEGKFTPNYPDMLQDIWEVFCNMEINIIGFLIPICIMGYCYCRVIRTLLSCTNRKKTTRAIRLILVVVIVFFLFWTPYHVLIFLETLKHYDFFANCSTLKFIDYGMHATEALAFSHCCLNPVIYAFAGEKFRKYLYHLFLKCISFICVCGPCSQYKVSSPTTIPESVLSSNQTQHTSDQDGSILL
uniref:C-X3-C motif chemokine receptor 1 n=1 Tax=Sphenodon punctatus TaxID=8508 RepID=A0A8D0GYT6_SPHPU